MRPNLCTRRQVRPRGGASVADWAGRKRLFPLPGAAQRQVQALQPRPQGLRAYSPGGSGGCRHGLQGLQGTTAAASAVGQRSLGVRSDRFSTPMPCGFRQVPAKCPVDSIPCRRPQSLMMCWSHGQTPGDKRSTSGQRKQQRAYGNTGVLLSSMLLLYCFQQRARWHCLTCVSAACAGSIGAITRALGDALLVWGRDSFRLCSWYWPCPLCPGS